MESATLPGTLNALSEVCLSMKCPERAIAPAQTAVYTLAKETEKIRKEISNITKHTMRADKQSRAALVERLGDGYGVLAYSYFLMGSAALLTDKATKGVAALKKAEAFAGFNVNAVFAAFLRGEEGFLADETDAYWQNGVVDYETATPALPRHIRRTVNVLAAANIAASPPPRETLLARAREDLEDATKATPCQLPSIASTPPKRKISPRLNSAKSVKVPLPPPLCHKKVGKETFAHVPVPPGRKGETPHCPKEAVGLDNSVKKHQRRHGPFSCVDFGSRPAKCVAKLCLQGSSAPMSLEVSTGVLSVGSASIIHAHLGEFSQKRVDGVLDGLLPIHCLFACSADNEIFVTSPYANATIMCNDKLIGTMVHKVTIGDTICLFSGDSAKYSFKLKKQKKKSAPKIPHAPPKKKVIDESSEPAILPPPRTHIIAANHEPEEAWLSLKSESINSYIKHLKKEVHEEEVLLQRKPRKADGNLSALRAVCCIEEDMPCLWAEGVLALGNTAAEEKPVVPMQTAVLSFTEKSSILYPIIPMVRDDGSVVAPAAPALNATSASDDVDEEEEDDSATPLSPAEGEFPCLQVLLLGSEMEGGQKTEEQQGEYNSLAAVSLACNMTEPPRAHRISSECTFSPHETSKEDVEGSGGGSCSSSPRSMHGGKVCEEAALGYSTAAVASESSEVFSTALAAVCAAFEDVWWEETWVGRIERFGAEQETVLVDEISPPPPPPPPARDPDLTALLCTEAADDSGEATAWLNGVRAIGLSNFVPSISPRSSVMVALEMEDADVFDDEDGPPPMAVTFLEDEEEEKPVEGLSRLKSTVKMNISVPTEEVPEDAKDVTPQNRGEREALLSKASFRKEMGLSPDTTGLSPVGRAPEGSAIEELKTIAQPEGIEHYPSLAMLMKY